MPTCEKKLCEQHPKSDREYLYMHCRMLMKETGGLAIDKRNCN